MFEYILSDLYRYVGNKKVSSLIFLFFRNRYFRFQFFLRLSRSNNYFISLLSSLFKSRLSISTGNQISKNVVIGFGLYIPHGNVIINSSAILGDNCNICQFTTIGSIKKTSAIIGNNVYIGPSVSIVEDVNISDNVVVGAGSVVNKNIPSNIVVGGVPAKKINHLKDIKMFINNIYV